MSGRKSRGFTLIELVIVMAVVLILTGTAGGLSSKYVSRRQLESAAFELVQDLRQTQSDAMFGRRTLKFTLDVHGNSYSFERTPGGDSVSHEFSTVVGYASVVAGATGVGSSVNFGSVTCPLAGSADLYFDSQGRPKLDLTGATRIDVSEGQIVLADRSGDVLRVYISSVLGRVRMAWD